LDVFTLAQGHELAWFREGNQIFIALLIVDVMALATSEIKSAMRLVSLPSQYLPSIPEDNMRVTARAISICCGKLRVISAI
jgi:hypothetical protein